MSADKMKQVAKDMKKIDFCMMTTKNLQGQLQSRPMSNNGDVEYEGDSWFFSYEDTDKVNQLKKDPAVGLSFTGDNMLFIHVEGSAEFFRDKQTMEEHWQKGLDRWFPDGVDTEGIVLIKVAADNIHYWHKEEEFEFDV